MSTTTIPTTVHDIEKIVRLRGADGTFVYLFTLSGPHDERIEVEVDAVALVSYSGMRKSLLRDHGTNLDIRDLGVRGGPRWEELVSYAMERGEK